MQHSWGDPFYLHKSREVEAQRAALSLRQDALKNELLRMRQQRLIEARGERRAELRAHVERLENQVYHYERKVSSPANTSSTNNSSSWTSSRYLNESPQHLPGSRESMMIERLVQQNDQIMALLLPRRHDSDNPLRHTSRDALDKPSIASSKTNNNAQPQLVQSTEEEHATAQPEALKEVPAKQFLSPISALPWIPDFEWTDEDEMALERLEKDEGAQTEVPASDIADTNTSAKENEASKVASTNLKAGMSADQKSRDRLESRKKLEALLSASLKNASGGTLRKPRWRLEAEAESDDVSSIELQDEEEMEPLQIFRSAVLAVLYTVHLKQLLMTKKLAEKESSMRDFEAMLRVYFDATRMWLGKVVRTPLLSLLQDSSLDVDISSRSGLAGSNLRGFAKKFGGILARRPPAPASVVTDCGQSSESTVDPGKLLKLKVRIKGILQALGKAIVKKEVPSGILDFWKRISSDGVYFPPSYQLFDEERQHLEFDSLGATRRMDFDGSNLGDHDEVGRLGEIVSSEGGISRFNVVVINFLFVRILIPHVILQPWNVGIGPKNIGKQASANLSSLATLLYCVCKKLSPLPPPVETPEASFLGRRRSKTIATSQPNASDDSSGQSRIPLSGIDPALAPIESQDEEHNAETYFLSIREIGLCLVPDKNFPTTDAQVIQIVREQRAMLYETLTHLRSQLHGPQEKL